jgi:hypothetical protein
MLLATTQIWGTGLTAGNCNSAPFFCSTFYFFIFLYFILDSTRARFLRIPMFGDWLARILLQAAFSLNMG